MYGNPYYSQMSRFQPTPQTYNTPLVQQPDGSIGLLGKVVDSADVVRATSIPFDGSVSYFPLADGSAILTKQLQKDGTSRTIVYKPSEEAKPETPKYVTVDEMNEKIKSELEAINKQIEAINEKIKVGD